MPTRMFCAELGDYLVTAHIASRADEVRNSVAATVEPGAPTKIGWTKAKRLGWRVIPVHVTRIEPR